MEKERKFEEKKCLRCQKYFKHSKDMEIIPHLCLVCSDFFKRFNSKGLGKDKAPQESRPPAKIVTKNVTP
jgi:hypothetical protein